MKRHYLFYSTLLLLLVAFIPQRLFAATYSGSCGTTANWTLDSETGTLRITGTGAMTDYYNYSGAPWYGYQSDIKAITIESGITNVGKRAFGWCSNLSSISIPESVTSIGEDAFAGCTSLASVNIPEGVTSIGNYAFGWCRNLLSISIPKSVTSIEEDAFYSCVYVESNFVNNSSLDAKKNKYWGAFIGEEELDNGLILNGNEIVGCRPWVTSVIIPENVTSFGDEAFRYCTSLTSINIPESVTSIGKRAFMECM